MDITGKIIAVLEKRSGVSQRTGNSWMTQEFVLETFDQHPRKVCFEVFGEERINQFAIEVGQTRTVSFDIDAREWTDKNGVTRWQNGIRAWRCFDPAQAAQQPAQATQQAAPAALAAPAPQADPLAGGDEEYSGMPF